MVQNGSFVVFTTPLSTTEWHLNILSTPKDVIHHKILSAQTHKHRNFMEITSQFINRVVQCTHKLLGCHAPDHNMRVSFNGSKKKCFSIAFRHTLVVLEMH